MLRGCGGGLEGVGWGVLYKASQPILHCGLGRGVFTSIRPGDHGVLCRLRSAGRAHAPTQSGSDQSWMGPWAARCPGRGNAANWGKRVESAHVNSVSDTRAVVM